MRNLWLVIALVLLSGCLQGDDRRALTEAEIADEVFAKNGRLLTSATIHTTSVILMETDKEIICSFLQARDNGHGGGGSIHRLTKPAEPPPVVVIQDLVFIDRETKATFCINIHDPALQSQVARVQVAMPDGMSTQVESAGKPALIVSTGYNRMAAWYQVDLLDQQGRILHSHTE